MRPDVHYVRNGDVSLAYQVVGEGPRDLLLVFGFLSNIEYAWIYPSMAAFLTRLAGFSRLILMDRRGSGLSDRFVVAPPIEVTLEDLYVVLDEVGSTRTTLVGLWEGCATSVLFAATHPERVSSLVLFGAAAAETPHDDYSLALWDEAQWEDWLLSIKEGWGTRAWVVRNARWMAPALLDAPEELEQWISYTRLSASPSSAEAVMRIDKDIDIRQVLATVQSPTLVLHRTGDQIQPIIEGRYVASKIPNAKFVEIPGDDGIPWLGDVESVLTEIEAFVVGPQKVSAAASDRRLATVLFTDIVASTERSAEMGDVAWKGTLEAHHAVVRAGLARHGGREISTAGDGFFATFEGPAAAARCAVELTSDLSAIDLRIRAGVHTGEVETIDGEIGGIGVTIGARVAAMAGPSEVLATSTVKDLTAGSGIIFSDAGEHALKGVPDRWHLYRVMA
ncbi:MAG: adenylate/guanylate cyclase domain-containing protein [Ilumatobacteraceae bacterium]|nr:adenylate/guanylate cyclase domain-containing protein [Ilumatobacteraceae bacterium]